MVGHMSDTVLSDGVTVDDTPPIRLKQSHYRDNMLLNPSFENSASPARVEELKMTHTCQYDTLTNWIINDNGCAVIATAAADIVQDGSKFLALKGTISQRVTQLNIGSLYRFTFYTSHLPFDRVIKSNNEGFVEFDGEKHSFMLYTKPSRSDHSFVLLSWHLHTFIFKAFHAEAIVKIGAYGNNVGIAVDNIQLQEIITLDKESGKADGHVSAHTVFVHSWSSIHASWTFFDAESGIKEYMWAIGKTFVYSLLVLQNIVCHIFIIKG